MEVTPIDTAAARPPIRSRNRFAVAREPLEVIHGVTLLGSRRVNFFAVAEGRSITLVDCGFRGHWRYLEAWLDATGRRLSDIEAIALTHGHADHVGFAADLAVHGVPVHVHAADVAFATDPHYRRPPQRLRARLWRPRALSLLAEAVSDGVLRQPMLVDPRPFRHGDHLDAPGGLQVVAVPGHNPGSCALYAPGLGEAGALFSGDALMTLDPMFGAVGPVVFAEDSRRDGDALAGLSHLSGHHEAALLPAHGEPWPEPGSVGRAVAAARISTP